MDRDVSCQCGQVRGRLHHTEQCTRIKCYCKDCQAFANWLGKPEAILDAQGGSDVVVAHPRLLEFTHGMGAVKCMSLSEQGMLRWYAGCCNSAIGNTARDIKSAFVGLSHSFLAPTPREMDETFGPVQMVSNTKGARGPVPSSGWGAFKPMLGFVKSLLAARLSGSYRNTPFFTPDARPVAVPTVLTAQERAALDSAALDSAALDGAARDR